MTIEFDEANPKELRIIKRGSKLRSLFFALMGLLFQILFVWGYWSFLDTTGPWVFFLLGIINSEMFPFTAVLFLFGGGCFLIAIKEGVWIECWIINKKVSPERHGIERRQQLFRWTRSTFVLKNHIQALRIHTIPLDRIKSYNRYQLEIDYFVSSESPVENLVIYSDDSENAHATILRITQKIHELLEISQEIEGTEASPSFRDFP
ncbi:MAG: hypothetical protein ACXAC8_04835 [Candidatus Hodarchaeales archaeon]|jgi:hypothetical protein